MSELMIGFGGLLALLVLLGMRTPVGTAMLAVGIVGMWIIHPSGERAVAATVAGAAFHISSEMALTILPLFILMGNLACVSGMTRDVYSAAHAWLGHMRGGLASSTILGCAGFSALTGSSLACAVTMGRVALPEMKRYGYDDALATGTVAAGGTLGILIPPSAGFVIYAILTEQSIARLFLAGVIPGAILASLFILAIWWRVRRNPKLAPSLANPAPMRERIASLGRAGWFMGVLFLSIGGIYTGVFSAIEAAGIGAFLSFVVCLVRRSLTWSALREALANTLQSTATAFYIIIGAFVFTPFIARTGLPATVTQAIIDTGASPMAVLVICLLALTVLGMFMDGFAILVLTLPILQPLMESYGFDMVWFGVLMVIVLEMGLISPPVGINVFVVKSIAPPEVSLNTIFRGIWPFWFAMLALIVLLLLFPQLALFMPQSMYGVSIT
jgi:tripartite ATP-independent transporter DctM subunit